MSTVTALPAREKSKHADDRAGIRAAIAAEAKAHQAVEAHKSAVERARALLGDAEAELTKKQGAVTKARASEARRLADAARSATPRPKSEALRDARAAERDAEDEAEAARAAVAALEGEELAELEQDVARAQAAVLQAVNSFLVRSVETALARAREAKATFLGAQEIVWGLVLDDKDAPVLSEWADEIKAKEKLVKHR